MRKKVFIFLLIFFIFNLTSCRKEGNVLKISFPNTMFIFDPHQTGWSTDCKVNSNVFETLVKIKQNLEIVPFLAERWYNPNPREWVFDLRKGVKFPNGEELTAEIVKKNFLRISTRELYSPYSNIAKIIDRVKVLSRYKVSFLLKKRSDNFLILLSDIKLIYLGNNLFSKSSDNKKRIFLGTGPFYFYEIGKDKVILRRFLKYWRRPSHIEEIQFYFNITNAANSKNYDISEIFTFPKKVENNFHLLIKPSNYIYFLIFNLRKKPFSDKRLRALVSSLLPYEKILNELKIPNSYRINQLVPPWLRYSLKENEVRSEKGECKKKFLGKIIFVFRKTNEISKITSKVILSELKKCFPNLVLLPLSDREWRQKLFFSKDLDMTLFRYGSDSAGVDDVLIKFFHTYDGGRGILNLFDYSDKELDKLIDEAEKEENLDLKEKKYRIAHKKALETKYFIPLFIVPNFYLVRNSIKEKENVDIGNIYETVR